MLSQVSSTPPLLSNRMLRGTRLEFAFEEDFSFVSIHPRAISAGTADTTDAAGIELASVRSEVQIGSEVARRVFGSEPELQQVIVTAR